MKKKPRKQQDVVRKEERTNTRTSRVSHTDGAAVREQIS